MSVSTLDEEITTVTITVIERFNEAFNRHDADEIMTLMTDDCVFENTSPAPDGARFDGQDAVRAFWDQLFHSTPDASFETEELVAAGDRCTVRWRYAYTDANGAANHIRGVDIFRVRDGKVAEKLAYVKG